MMRVEIGIFLRLLIILGAVGALFFPVAAQGGAGNTQVEAYQLRDVDFARQMVISLPEDWLVWNSDAYGTRVAAIQGLSSFFEEAGQHFSCANDCAEHISLAAVFPAMSEGGQIELMVQLYSRQVIAAESGISIEEFNIGNVVPIFAFPDYTVLEDEARSHLVGYERGTVNTRLNILTDFVAEDMIAYARLAMPNDFYDANPLLASMIVSSLRLDSDSFSPFVPEFGAVVESHFPVPPVADCTVTASGNTNLYVNPGTDHPVQVSLSNGESYIAFGQALDSTGIAWWGLAENVWVREDAVTEWGECSALPVFQREYMS